MIWMCENLTLTTTARWRLCAWYITPFIATAYLHFSYNDYWDQFRDKDAPDFMKTYQFVAYGLSFVFLILHFLTLVGFIIAAFIFLGCMMGCWCFSPTLFNDNFRAFWYNERRPHRISRKKMTRMIDKMYKFSIQ